MVWRTSDDRDVAVGESGGRVVSETVTASAAGILIVVYNCAVDATVLRQALDDVFDQALVYHGFTDYMRDYEVIVYATADPRTGIPPAYLRYLFRYCVEATCRTTVAPPTWRESLDDRLVDHETGVDLDGYVWGVKWHCLYPGAQVVDGSPGAQRWAGAVGIEFHEVRIETNAHALTLIFSDLQVSELPPGYSPFVTEDVEPTAAPAVEAHGPLPSGTPNV
ncbi:hypothetical protein [Micromonospora sp. NPDC023956]|uniref:YxiG-like protein n=1 Tax=Micromonospora sp. NPDC023956 TaxID=3155722 RepID=UPI00340CE3BE